MNEQEIAESHKFDEETKSMIVCLNDGCVLKPDNLHNNLWRHRNDLCVKNGILETKFGNIFVPFKFRLKILTVAHGLHHGIQQTLGRLRSKFFWPNLKASVESFVKQCRICSLVKQGNTSM